MRPVFVLLLLASSSLLGCSLLGLERVQVATCDRCDDLNLRDGLTGCDVWQCGPNAYCVRGRPDVDGDGDVSVACGGSDCDDGNGAVRGSAAEMCDGLDNDCNGLVDDASALAEPASVVLGDVLNPELVTISPALDDGVLLSFRVGETTSLARITDLVASPELDLVTVTNADGAASPVLDGETIEGCPIPTAVSLRPTPCGVGDTCPGSLGCVTTPEGVRVCESAVIPRMTPLPTDCATHAECQDGILCNGIELCDPRSPMSDPITGCRDTAPPCTAPATCSESRVACVDTTLGMCAIDDVSIAPISPTVWMTATIDGRCPSGTLRFGSLSTVVSPLSLRYWGDSRVTTIWPGVELDEDGCTTTDRSLDLPPTGASGVTVAALPIDAEYGQAVVEGLAAWRTEALCSAGECAASAPVAILGLWHEHSESMGASITWVNASDDGQPVLLDAAAGTELAVSTYRVGAGAGRRAGYIVGYAGDGGVALSFVPALGAPHPSCLESAPPCIDRPPGPDGILGTADDPAAQSRLGAALPMRTSMALTPPRQETLTESGVLTDLSLAVGSGDDVPLVVAWTTASELVIANLIEDPVAQTLTELDRERIGFSGARYLHVAYLPDGLTVSREGAPIASSGGYVVTWTSDEGTFALRLDGDGALIEPGVIVLDDRPSIAPHAYLDRDGASARVRVIAHQGTAFVAFPSVCGPSR